MKTVNALHNQFQPPRKMFYVRMEWVVCLKILEGGRKAVSFDVIPLDQLVQGTSV